MTNRTITQRDIDDLIDGAPSALWRKINPDQLARANAITTKLRRRAAFIAVARDAVAAVLIERFGLKDFRQLTAAIRRGCGQDADFDAINRAACAALFPEEL